LDDEPTLSTVHHGDTEDTKKVERMREGEMGRKDRANLFAVSHFSPLASHL